MSSTPQPNLNDRPSHETEERDDLVIRKAMNWSLVVIALIAGIAGAIFWFQRDIEEPETSEQKQAGPARTRETAKVSIPKFRFTDITRQAGIDFVHENGATGQKLLPETMGGGCAFFDFDNDGDVDLLFVNSTNWPDQKVVRPATMKLYANDGKGKFTDVTAGSGLDVSFYGQGVAIGDYDNDGLADVYISAVGPNHLYKNLGKGKFKDVTAAANVAGDANAWGSSCGWFDYDNDGDLDLFVCNYLEWSAEFDRRQPFTLVGGQGKRGYGRPQVFPGTYPYLFRNDGKGKFTDVTAIAKLQVNDQEGKPLAKSLGVTFCDFDNNGYLDIVVANDTVPNLFFRNRGDGTFEEIGRACNIALDKGGEPRGAMGIHVAQFRNSDTFGVLIGNYAHEPTALYVTQNARNAPLQFVDDAVSNGLGPLTEHDLTFGVFFFDCDLDGRLDILAANGHLEQDIKIVDKTQSYEQPPLLLWNAGPKQDTEFLPVVAPTYPLQKPQETKADYQKRIDDHKKQVEDYRARMSDFIKPMVGRGAAYADIDGDGDLDVLLVGNGQPARLLRNDQQFGHRWLRLRLQGTTSNRDAIGSWVTVRLKDGTTLRQQVMPTCSYLSQVERTLTFGLGKKGEVDSVEIRWPTGKTDKHAFKFLNRQYTVTEPGGK